MLSDVTIFTSVSWNVRLIPFLDLLVLCLVIDLKMSLRSDPWKRYTAETHVPVCRIQSRVTVAWLMTYLPVHVPIDTNLNLKQNTRFRGFFLRFEPFRTKGRFLTGCGTYMVFYG